MIFENIDKEMSDFYTFETSWIGSEVFDFQNHKLRIPVLNLYVENKDVLKYLNIEDKEGVYIKESYFLFEEVSKLEKKIHLQKNQRFVASLSQTLKLENIFQYNLPFEFGGMGIYNRLKYDGLLFIYAFKCSYVINKNSPISLEHISMNDYNPFLEEWLNTDNFIF